METRFLWVGHDVICKIHSCAQTVLHYRTSNRQYHADATIIATRTSVQICTTVRLKHASEAPYMAPHQSDSQCKRHDCKLHKQPHWVPGVGLQVQTSKAQDNLKAVGTRAFGAQQQNFCKQRTVAGSCLLSLLLACSAYASPQHQTRLLISPPRLFISPPPRSSSPTHSLHSQERRAFMWLPPSHSRPPLHLPSPSTWVQLVGAGTSQTKFVPIAERSG